MVGRRGGGGALVTDVISPDQPGRLQGPAIQRKSDPLRKEDDDVPSQASGVSLVIEQSLLTNGDGVPAEWLLVLGSRRGLHLPHATPFSAVHTCGRVGGRKPARHLVLPMPILCLCTKPVNSNSNST